MMSAEKGSDEKVSVVDREGSPEEEKEVPFAEVEGKGPAIQVKEGGKPQVAMVEEARDRAKPEGKLPKARKT